MVHSISSNPQDRMPATGPETTEKTKNVSGDGSSAQKATYGKGGDHVVLSQAAMDVQTVMAHIGGDESAAEQRAQRVEELTQQVQSGTYHVDCEKVSGKMLQKDAHECSG